MKLKEYLVLFVLFLVITCFYFCFCSKEQFENSEIKVDLVYTWVSGMDVDYNKRKKLLSENKLSSEKKIEHFIPEAVSMIPAALNYTLYDTNTSCNRLSNMDEIEYSIKSVEKFIPWINNIYIVLPKVHFKYFPVKKLKGRKLILVAQEDILSNELGNFNPSFNSNAIETCFDYIKGLSNLFMYMNDDVIITKPLKLEQFYKDGKMLIIYQKFMGLDISSSLSSSIMNLLTNKYETSSQARYNSNKIMSKINKKHNDLLISHSPIIIDKNIYKEIKNKIKPDVIATLNNKFRSSTDVVIPHYIYPHYISSINKSFTSNKININELKWSDYETLNYVLINKIDKNDSFLLINDERNECKTENTILVNYLTKLTKI